MTYLEIKLYWVTAEREAAFTRLLNDPALRLIPVLLDKTPLPSLLQAIKYIDGTDEDHLHIARQILGIETDAAFRLAVQAFIDEAGLHFREFVGVGVLVTCPRCGATIDNLEGWKKIDHLLDAIYFGVRCKVCSWTDGSEM